MLNFLASLPAIHAAYGTCIAYPTSLQELAIMDVQQRGPQPRIAVDTEPACMALGPSHLAVGINNKVSILRHPNGVAFAMVPNMLDPCIAYLTETSAVL